MEIGRHQSESPADAQMAAGLMAMAHPIQWNLWAALVEAS